MDEQSVPAPKTESVIRIPDDLRGCHPLISKTRKALEKTTPHHIGLILRPWEKGILNIRVTRGSINRALRLMQALITEAEARGWKIKPNAEKQPCAVQIGDDQLGITLRERTKRFEVSRDKSPSGYMWKEYRYEATGLFTLEITDYVADATRREWHDGKREKLEDTLLEFVDGLAAAAEARIKWHHDLAERGRQWKEDEIQREKMESRKRAELDRRQRLLKQAEDYVKAQVLRRLVADFLSSDNLPPFWTPPARDRWAGWAERIADKFDPFRNGYFTEKLAQQDLEASLDCR